MPGSKIHRKEDKNRRGNTNKLVSIGERAASFHARSMGPVTPMLARPWTVPDLLSGRATVEEMKAVKLTKLLLKVTVQRSLGAVQVLMAPESTVGDLIVVTVKQYKKEGRRPVLDGVDANGFDLHYSQFSLESLDRDEKLITLGSRNFFLFLRKSTPATESNDNSGSGSGGSILAPSCSKQADKATKSALPWLKFLF